MSIISGKEFNETHKGVSLYKFTNNECNHYGFQYKDGLNIDILELNTSYCCAGGLYFTTNNADFCQWIKRDSVWVWDVTIPDDARVVIEPSAKAKADKIIISNQRLIADMPYWSIEDNQIYALHVNNNIFFTYGIKEILTENALCKAMESNYQFLRSISNPSEAVSLAAINNNCYAIQYINNPSETLQLAAVGWNGSVIQHIQNPSKAVKLAAIASNSYCIAYINDPDEEIQLATIAANPHNVRYIKIPTEKVQLEVFLKNTYAARNHILNPCNELIKKLDESLRPF